MIYKGYAAESLYERRKSIYRRFKKLVKKAKKMMRGGKLKKCLRVLMQKVFLLDKAMAMGMMGGGKAKKNDWDDSKDVKMIDFFPDDLDDFEHSFR